MLDEAHAVAIARQAVDAGLEAGRAAGPVGASVQAEALLISARSALTRFADHAIHQNVAEDGSRLSLRVVIDGRIGVIAANQLDRDRIRDVAATAARFAMSSPKDPAQQELPGPQKASDVFAELWSQATAETTPERRASLVRGAFELCSSAGVSPAGSFATSDTVLAVANSKGVQQAARATEAEASLVCTAPDGSTGWAEWIGRDVDSCDPAALARRAADKALAARGAVPVDPGRWTVVLEPAAVSELFGLLSYCGFGALAEQEGRSFMSGRLGDKITGPEITVVDDAAEPGTLGWPFDFEGVPKRRVSLIERGVAVGVVHDSYTAGRADTRSTGHALPAPNSFGPAALNLVVAAGGSSLEELIAGTQKGLLVTRFFYTNPLDPRETTFTGMTRDGLFLIERGKVGRAARNLRVTENVLEALSRVTGVSAQVESHRSVVGTVVAPAMRIDGFNFTSATEF